MLNMDLILHPFWVIILRLLLKYLSQITSTVLIIDCHFYDTWIKILSAKSLKVDMLSLTLNIALCSTIVADDGTVSGHSYFWSFCKMLDFIPIVKILSSELEVDSYDLVRLDQLRRSGGDACYIKSSIAYCFKDSFCGNTESSFVDIFCQNLSQSYWVSYIDHLINEILLSTLVMFSEKLGF